MSDAQEIEIRVCAPGINAGCEGCPRRVNDIPSIEIENYTNVSGWLCLPCAEALGRRLVAAAREALR